MFQRQKISLSLFIFFISAIIIATIAIPAAISYGQTPEQQEKVPILNISKLQVSSTTAVINKTITLQGSIENTSDYPAKNTFLTIFSANVPTIDITNRYPSQLVDIEPHSTQDFKLEFFPTTTDDIEISVMAMPENGMIAKSEMIKMSVLSKVPQNASIDYSIVLLTVVIPIAGGGAVAFWIYMRRPRKHAND